MVQEDFHLLCELPPPGTGAVEGRAFARPTPTPALPGLKILHPILGDSAASYDISDPLKIDDDHFVKG